MSPLHWGAALWLAGSAPPLAQGLAVQSADEATRGAFTQLTRLTPIYPSLWVVDMSGVALVSAVTILFGRTRLRTLLEDIRTEALGVDIMATHDPVPAVLLALNDARRTRLIAQCGSLTLDHTRYFRNGSTSLPLVIGEIKASLMGQDVPKGACQEHSMGNSFHRAGLTRRRWLRLAALLLLPALIVQPVAVYIPSAVTAILVLGAIIFGLGLVRSSCDRWMEKVPISWGFSPKYVAALEDARRRRRSGILGVWVLL